MTRVSARARSTPSTLGRALLLVLIAVLAVGPAHAPTGVFLGLPNVQTGLGFDAPALKGATNVVLFGADHREVSYGPRDFGVYDNQPVADATVEISAVDPATGVRQGGAAHRKTTGADGAWGW